MVLVSIIFIIIGILLIIGVASMDESNNSFGNFCRVCGGFCGSVILISIGIGMLVYEPKDPKAIDVYRGKTELQIEKKIVNDKVVSADSTVIWRK